MLKKNRVIANSFLYLFICIFFMGCKGINNDSTEEYVDSYSKTALQQADIIMDGIQSGNCEEIADIFCPYIKKNHPELQTDIKTWMKYIDGNILMVILYLMIRQQQKEEL